MNNTKFVKRLTLAIKRPDGRNNYGRITAFHKGGGTVHRYRCVDFFRTYDDVPALVRRFERDPNRNASIALICYQNEVVSYIIAPVGLKVGHIIYSSIDPVPLDVGNTSRLANFSSGTFLHNLEIWPGSGARYMRSCGVVAQLLKRYNDKYTLVKLRTGEQRLFNASCKATLGVPSQLYVNISRTNIGSAGRARWLGRRPVVRGVAMNPVDHPHGGAGGRVDRSPWGWFTKGPRTGKIPNPKYVLRTRRQSKKK